MGGATPRREGRAKFTSHEIGAGTMSGWVAIGSSGPDSDYRIGASEIMHLFVLICLQPVYLINRKPTVRELMVWHLRSTYPG